jgi:hypothetical protein
VSPLSFNGQRPSVILRGMGHCNATGKCDTHISLPHTYNVSAHSQFPPEVYLVRFDQTISLVVPYSISNWCRWLR